MKVSMVFALCAAICLCTSAWAFPMFDDFEDDTLDPQWTAGTLSTDQAVSGDQSLYVGDGEIALFDFSPQGGGNAGVLTLWVYDLGATTGGADASGPRWGIYSEDKGVVANVPNSQSVAGAAIIWRSFLNGDNGYGNSVGENRLTSGTWFSPNFQGGPRVEGWMKWTIELDQNFDVIITANYPDGTLHSTTTAPGELMFDRNIGPNPLSGGRGFYLFGGSGDVAGVYVDNVRWVPEPASLSLLAIGGLMFIRRR